MLRPAVVPDAMGATQERSGDVNEACSECGRETPHGVAIEIRTESDKPTNAQYSREPYRVSTCRVCGGETAIRMNNA
jgi:rRNA maturation protein Nop10